MNPIPDSQLEPLANQVVTEADLKRAERLETAQRNGLDPTSDLDAPLTVETYAQTSDLDAGSSLGTTIPSIQS